MLSEGIYHLAFRRTNKKVVLLRDNEVFKYAPTIKLKYHDVYNKINDSLKRFCHNPITWNSDYPIDQYEKAILKLLKAASSEINDI